MTQLETTARQLIMIVHNRDSITVHNRMRSHLYSIITQSYTNETYHVHPVDVGHQFAHVMTEYTRQVNERALRRHEDSYEKSELMGDSHRACKCYVTAGQPAKLVLNKDSVPHKSMLEDRPSIEKRPHTSLIPDIFWNVTH